MHQILYKYTLDLWTWVYLASILILTIYFKFSRFWSVRNLDILALIALSPGLLFVERDIDFDRRIGFIWLFVVGGLILFRLLLDSTMVRRPLLEPNLTTGGMTFLGAALLIFLQVNVVARELTAPDLAGAEQLQKLLSGKGLEEGETNLANHGPGYVLLHLLPRLTSQAIASVEPEVSKQQGDYAIQEATSKSLAILALLAVVSGMVLIGVRHFDNIRIGIATAVLFLLIPYTGRMVGRIDHTLPAALLVWAIVCYRRPMISGLFIGLATGAIYYPLFLLPLWISFYWKRGLVRFLTGFLLIEALLVGSLAFFSADRQAFFSNVQQMFGWTIISSDSLSGLWQYYSMANPYRMTVFAAFVTMAFGFSLWPVQKNLGTLLSCSAAVMLGTQFWHGNGGGTFIGWYLPLLLLTVFRPNLEDRVAIATLREGFLRRRASTRTKAA